MHDEFIDPNWHVGLIHYPLGLLGVGLLIEILSLFWRRSTVRQAGRWMLLIGALACIPTAAIGLYAFRDVVAPGHLPRETWRQLAARSEWNQEQWDRMIDHIWFGVGGSAVAVLAAFIWLSCSDRGRQQFHWPALILIIAGLGLVSVAAWHGGEGVYRQRIAVAQESAPVGAAPNEATPAPMPVTPMPLTTAPATQVSATQAAIPARAIREPVNQVRMSHELRADITYYFPPLELHILLAGMTVAIAIGGFGVTLRRWSLVRGLVVPSGPSDGMRAADIPEQRLRGDVASRTPPADHSPGLSVTPQLFPARLWLWAFLFAAGTVLAGLWTTRDWSLSGLLRPLHDSEALHKHQRLFGHILFGGAIALLLLLGAILTRLAKRHRPLTVVLMLLLLGAVAGEIWLGVLLLFDSGRGPVTGFNP